MVPIGGQITPVMGETTHALQQLAFLSAGLSADDPIPFDFAWQQSLSSAPVPTAPTAFSFLEVGQQGLPQSSPHAQPVHLQALHSQFVHAPSAQPHSVHLQSFPQQQDAADPLSALTANAGNVSNTAAIAIVKPLKIFVKIDITLSSLRFNSALGSK